MSVLSNINEPVSVAGWITGVALFNCEGLYMQISQLEGALTDVAMSLPEVKLPQEYTSNHPSTEARSFLEPRGWTYDDRQGFWSHPNHGGCIVTRYAVLYALHALDSNLHEWPSRIIDEDQFRLMMATWPYVTP